MGVDLFENVFGQLVFLDLPFGPFPVDLFRLSVDESRSGPGLSPTWLSRQHVGWGCFYILGFFKPLERLGIPYYT